MHLSIGSIGAVLLARVPAHGRRDVQRLQAHQPAALLKFGVIAPASKVIFIEQLQSACMLHVYEHDTAAEGRKRCAYFALCHQSLPRRAPRKTKKMTGISVRINALPVILIDQSRSEAQNLRVALHDCQ